MRRRLLTLALLPFLLVASAAHGQKLPRLCYASVSGAPFCTTDNLGKVQVLIYNAGWCPDCNNEMAQLPAVYRRFKAQGVVFASLSGEGWNSGERPNATFLKAWKARHKIPFVVAGKFRDFGDVFGNPGAIPFTVIADRQGNVVKSASLEVSEIIAAIEQVLRPVRKKV